MTQGSTRAANTIRARKDWKQLADLAEEQGHTDLVERWRPPTFAEWKRIDRAIAGLRAAIAEAEGET